LGGKSPAVITESAHLPSSIKRLVWAKFLNAGQTCIAPDYLFVHQSKYKEVLEAIKKQILEYDYSFENNNYVQIINEANFQRLKHMLQQDKIVFGGELNEKERYFGPTLMADIKQDDRVMQEEIFGPILPIMAYQTIDEVIAFVNSGEKPLAAYLFTQDAALKSKWLSEVSFGGGCVNDAIMHITNANLPFGGVGNSGIGAYHGIYGLEAFSHLKSIFEKPKFFEPAIKYPPYNEGKMKWVKRFLKW
jgi:aldehyde dehydrogenase (NAD+)